MKACPVCYWEVPDDYADTYCQQCCLQFDFWAYVEGLHERIAKLEQPCECVFKWNDLSQYRELNASQFQDIRQRYDCGHIPECPRHGIEL